jgi:membrane-bound serine protease (ClpP class)
MKTAARIACLLLSAWTGGAAPAGASTNQTVYVLPIRNMIEPALVYVIRRGALEAQQTGADAVVIPMDTPGGGVDAAERITKILGAIEVPTYTFVERNAISAGAIIAMATDEIYMAPGSKIGDAMPIMMSPTGGVQEMPEGVEEKTVSYVAALIRSQAQKNGHDPELAECMVRREKEYRIGDEVICPSNVLLTLTNVEAERPVGEEGRPLLSSGTVASLDEMLERIGLADAKRIEMEVTASEKIARAIASMASVFLIAGLLGIYIEIRTPGIGLPGLLGAVCLAVFFYGHHIAGLAGMEDLLIFALGVLLLLIELLLIPGFGITGLAGITLMFAGIFLAMVERLPGGPFLPELPALVLPLRQLGYALVGTAAGVLLLGHLLPKSSLFGRLVLNNATSREEGYTVASAAWDNLVGREGAAITPLRPSGSARFGEERVDVIADGEYIQQGARVRVVEVRGNRVMVEPVDAGGDNAHE